MARKEREQQGLGPRGRLGGWNTWASCRDGDFLRSGVRDSSVLEVQAADEQSETGVPVQKLGSQAEDHGQPRLP